MLLTDILNASISNNQTDTSEQGSIKLLETMRSYNEACNYVADKAFSLKISNKFQLQRILYRDIRERFGLTAQFAIRIISKVVEAYKRDKTIKSTFRELGSI